MQEDQLITKLVERLSCNHNLIIKLGFELEFYVINSEARAEKAFIAELNNLKKDYFKFECERGNGQFEAQFEPNFDLIYWQQKIKDFKFYLASQFEKHQILFDPKPFADDYGSALHVHISLHSLDQYNIFESDSNDHIFLKAIYGTLDLLEEGMYYISSKENFKRFDHKLLTPTCISWGGNNRTHAVRVPMHNPCNKRFELRVCGADCNVERLIVYILISILHGLNDYSICYPKIYGNGFDKQYGCKQLPIDLAEAHKAFKEKGVLKSYLKELTGVEID